MEPGNDAMPPTAVDDPRATRGPDADAAGMRAAAADSSLLALVDRLAALLERSDLSELEVEVGATAVLLRKAGAITPPSAQGVPGGPGGTGAGGQAPAAGSVQVGPSTAEPTGTPAASPAGGSASLVVRAPLTGIFYGAPAPGSAPYVRVGGEVAVGQVIGLIEAMKLFNEIKSDQAGRVVKVVAENGQLVKAKQPLIEVEPL